MRTRRVRFFGHRAAWYTDASMNLPDTGFIAQSAGFVRDALMQGFMARAADINWSTPSWDLFIVLFFAVTVVLYGLSLGRERIIVMLVSMYMALAVVNATPLLSNLVPGADVTEQFGFKAAAFGSIFVALMFLLSRSALHRVFGKLAAGRWWQVLLFSMFSVGLLVSSVVSFLPEYAVQMLSPLTRKAFASDAARFFWIVAPVVSMAAVKMKSRRPRAAHHGVHEEA